MPDNIVTLNDILVDVFCKSGENVFIFFLKKTKLKLQLNRKLKKKWGGGQQQFKEVFHLLFLCSNPFLSLTLM